MLRLFVVVCDTYYLFKFDDFSTSELSEVSKNLYVNVIVNGDNDCVSARYRTYNVVYKVKEKRRDDTLEMKILDLCNRC